jgi:CBS domain-containing protein
MHLLDGRRVTVADLMEARLLRPGESLRFTRPRMRKTFRAEVTDQGRLRLTDGQEFQSPSRAAMFAASMRAVDGWHAWIVESTGRSLDAMRQELLDRTLARSTTDAVEVTEEESSPVRVHERLRAARTRAEANEPQKVSVRELLSLWGAKDRGDHIARIEADLANHGLATRPSFRSVTLDADVHLITAAQEAEQDVHGPRSSPVSSEDIDEAEPPIVGLTVGNLPSALRGITAVPPTADLDEAVTKMLLNDYSQLAVLAGSHTVRGAVTWRSITEARHRNPHARLADAIVGARDVSYETDLLEVLPDLRRSGFLFIRDEKNAVAGIITTADVVQQYEEMANPFILIGHLDRALRRMIARTVPIGEVVELCDPRGSRISSFDDLSMGDYQRILESPELWGRLGWSLDRKAVVARISEIRKIRNNVMHFNPDPLPGGTVDMLRNLTRLLRSFGG